MEVERLEEMERWEAGDEQGSSFVLTVGAVRMRRTWSGSHSIST